MALPPVYRSRYNQTVSRGPFGESGRNVYTPPVTNRPPVYGGRGEGDRGGNAFTWEKFYAGNPSLGYVPKGNSPVAPIIPPGGSGDDEFEPFVMPDYKDATYEKMMDLLNRQQQDLELAKATNQKTALIRLGSRSLAEKILGSADPALAGISSDPDTSLSTLAQIARQGRQLVQDVNNTENDRGNWFSSTRGNALTNAAYEQQKATTTATQDAEDYMSGLSQELQAALQDITYQRMGAEQDAMNRAIQMWILNGGGKKKKPTAPTGPGPQTPQNPAGPGLPWPTEPIYNPPPGGSPYPI